MFVWSLGETQSVCPGMFIHILLEFWIGEDPSQAISTTIKDMLLDGMLHFRLRLHCPLKMPSS